MYIPCDRDTSTTTTTKRRPVGRWSARHHLPRYHCGTRTTTAGRNAHPSARRSQGDGVLRSELLALAGYSQGRGHFADAATRSVESSSHPIRAERYLVFITHFLLLCCNPPCQLPKAQRTFPPFLHGKGAYSISLPPRSTANVFVGQAQPRSWYSPDPSPTDSTTDSAKVARTFVKKTLLSN